jgi:hypothetical protein
MTYSMQPSFKIVYLSLADNAETLREQLDGCPHVDRFKCVRVHNKLFDD